MQALKIWRNWIGVVVVLLSACQQLPAEEVDVEGPKGPTAVDVAIARVASAEQAIEYTGTTVPLREVTLRSQAQGQLQNLTVEVGDRVTQGQVLGKLDDALLVGALNEAKAERAAQVAELAQARSQVGAVSTEVEQARLAYDQAQADVLRLKASLQAEIQEARLEAQQTAADAKRLATLAETGALTAQEAEQAQTVAEQAQQVLANRQASAAQQITQAETAVKTAEQVLQSAIAQVSTEQQRVKASQGRVLAQQAVVDQARAQQAYGVLTAPISGLVLERLTEPGNLLQPGNDVLRLGDFSQVKVIVQLSELVIGQIRVGQTAQVRLDAFPKARIEGKVTRISPLANQTSRLLPVEVVIPNTNGRIGAGLLARVSFTGAASQRVTIPETALELVASDRPARSPRPPSDQPPQTSGTLFTFNARENSVQAKTVQLGQRRGGQVEVTRGLNPGDRYIVRSQQPLTDGEVVQLSAISETEAS